MENKLKELTEYVKTHIDEADSAQKVDNIRVELLGKNGKLTALLKDLKNVAQEARAKVGMLVNSARAEIESVIEKKQQEIERENKKKRLLSEEIDISLPAKMREKGALHPLNIVKKQIIDTFMGMGFSVAQGPEIETDYNCFEALNIPKDHPARDMQDTFYITEGILLRTHTSPAQVRTMMSEKGAIKILCPGRVYRADDDATHSPMFHQIEGLVVDKKVSLCDLKGLLDEFARRLFTGETKTRFRPSYFPFTEPSVEVDVTCTMCKGKGCRVCKGTGWIEILGAGVVNQRVLENCGIDANVYSGLAFGIGIERITMIKYGVPDIRLLFENDVRLLSQFK